MWAALLGLAGLAGILGGTEGPKTRKGKRKGAGRQAAALYGIPHLTEAQARAIAGFDIQGESLEGLGNAEGKKKVDVYAIITEKLMALIEGDRPLFWNKTWKRYSFDAARGALAINGKTRTVYSGANQITLGIMIPSMLGVRPVYVSYKQAEEMGGQVRKGEEGFPCVFYTTIYVDEQTGKIYNEKEGKDIKGLKKVLLTRYYTVFSVDQVEGEKFHAKIAKLGIVELPPADSGERMQECERIVENMPNKPVIKNIRQNRAYYSPDKDTVTMPYVEQFTEPQAYYATLFHELVHSTKHAKRLGERPGAYKTGGGPNTRGYAYEELVAEMGAAFLCAQSGIAFSRMVENSAAYLKSWKGNLMALTKEQPDCLIRAAMHARKAVDYILDKQESGTVEVHEEDDKDKDAVKELLAQHPGKPYWHYRVKGQDVVLLQETTEMEPKYQPYKLEGGKWEQYQHLLHKNPERLARYGELVATNADERVQRVRNLMVKKWQDDERKSFALYVLGKNLWVVYKLSDNDVWRATNIVDDAIDDAFVVPSSKAKGYNASTFDEVIAAIDNKKFSVPQVGVLHLYVDNSMSEKKEDAIKVAKALLTGRTEEVRVYFMRKSNMMIVAYSRDYRWDFMQPQRKSYIPSNWANVKGIDEISAEGELVFSESRQVGEKIIKPDLFVISDIDRKKAEQAFRGTSFSPEVRGRTYVADYVASNNAMANAYAERWLRKGWELDELVSKLEDYKRGLLDKINVELGRFSSNISTMIAGRSGFNTTRAKKASDSSDKASQAKWDYIEKFKKRMEALLKDEKPVIRSGASDALVQLQEKLRKEEELHELMIEANKFLKPKKLNYDDADERKVIAMLVEEFGKEAAAKIIKMFGPFQKTYIVPPYEISNSNKRIAELRKRIEKEQNTTQVRAQEKEGEELWANDRGDECTVIKNTEANRLQLKFDGKPSKAIIEAVKAQAFKWAPSQTAWQRQLTDNAYRAASKLLTEIGYTKKSGNGNQEENPKQKEGGGEQLPGGNQKNQGRPAKKGEEGPQVKKPVHCIETMYPGFGRTLVNSREPEHKLTLSVRVNSFVIHSNRPLPSRFLKEIRRDGYTKRGDDFIKKAGPNHMSWEVDKAESDFLRLTRYIVDDFGSFREESAAVTRTEPKNEPEPALSTSTMLFEVYYLLEDKKRFPGHEDEEKIKAILDIALNNGVRQGPSDPPVVWLDPKNREYYVVYGYSQVEAFRRLVDMRKEQFQLIPALTFDGTEAEAIAYAKKRFADQKLPKDAKPAKDSPEVKAFKKKQTGVVIEWAEAIFADYMKKDDIHEVALVAEKKDYLPRLLVGKMQLAGENQFWTWNEIIIDKGVIAAKKFDGKYPIELMNELRAIDHTDFSLRYEVTQAGKDHDAREAAEKEAKKKERQGKKHSPAPETEKPQQPSSRAGVMDFEVYYLHTDPKRFQNRDTDHSGESVQRIINAVQEGKFSWAAFDPITVWLDPNDGNYYVLSGHSRTEAFRRLVDDYRREDFQLIPGRTFEGTEAEAIEFALNSNTLSTKETELERAKYYAAKRSKGATNKELSELAKEREGKNASYILALSHLNPRGYIVGALKALENTSEGNRATVVAIASWMGEARQRNPQLTDAHENEVARWLVEKGYGTKSGQFSNKRDFFDRLQKAIDRKTEFGVFKNPDQPLNIAQAIGKNVVEDEFDRISEQLRKEVTDLEADIAKKSDRYYKAVAAGEITMPKAKELLEPLQAELASAKTKLNRHVLTKNAVMAASKNQGALFGVRNIVDPVELEFNRIAKELKAKVEKARKQAKQKEEYFYGASSRGAISERKADELHAGYLAAYRNAQDEYTAHMNTQERVLAAAKRQLTLFGVPARSRTTRSRTHGKTREVVGKAKVAADRVRVPNARPGTGLGGIMQQIGTAQGGALIRLGGQIGKFINAVERKEYALVLRGEKGAGKTRLLFQFMDAFAQQGYKVAYFSLEIDASSQLVTQMAQEYISPAASRRVDIASDAPEGMATIEQAAATYDVVAIDSWSKIKGARQEDFDRLRKKYPNTFFLVIFQSTTNGTARGGMMPEYDAQAVVQVDRPGVAYFEKNRYSSGQELKYDVFRRQTIR